MSDNPQLDNNTPISIQVDSLDKWYKRGKVKALTGVSLAVERAEIFGLIGPNGAGKTTLMQCLLGIIRPTGGTIAIDGHDPNHISVKEKIAFLPERPIFDGWMTARQFLRYHHMLAKQPFADGKKDVEEALDLVQLEQAARNRKITQFSRGMLQRVGLAQMLIGKPSICFLDEPTSGMDPIGMELVRDLLVYWKERNVTIVLNSHHLDEVEKICDRVAFIKKGHIESIERIQEVNFSQIKVAVKWINGSTENGSTESGSRETQPSEKELSEHESSPNGLREVLENIASSMNVSLESIDDSCARFVLNERADKAVLIKKLVEADVPIEEVILEKKALKDFFVERARDSEEGEQT